MKRFLKLATTLACAALLAGLSAGCAQMPTASGVVAGHGDTATDDNVSILAAGPLAGASPESIVHGFLLAVQAGPTTTTPFAVAQEYLTPDAVAAWRPGEWVTILDDSPTLSVREPSDEETEDLSADPNTVRVVASGIAVAQLDSRGVYTEADEPEPQQVEFTLQQVDGEWRIAELDNGVVLPEQVFGSAFRQTRLYFASPDSRAWVPDVRWFPRQTWQTNAVQELFAGPPDWLEHAVRTGVPEGTTLMLDTITQGTGNAIQVHVSEQVAAASEAQRGALAAQLAATLAEESGLPDIELIDHNGPIAVPDIQQPRLARTNGSALAIMDDEVFRAAGNELRPLRPAVSTYGLNPTALAVAFGRDGLLVVRDGTTRLIRLDRNLAEDSAEPDAVVAQDAGPEVAGADFPPGFTLEPPAMPIEPGSEADETVEVNGNVEIPDVIGVDEADILLEGTDLIAPSIDTYGIVWSGETAGPIAVVVEPGAEYEVNAPWLSGRQINALRVAPDGVRVAVISTELDVADGEPVGEPVIHVAGIRRDAQNVPLSLDQPKQVGASLRAVEGAVWQDDATLAVIAQANTGGEPVIFWVGVGGLDAPGGLPQQVPGISSPVALTASVGTGNMLVIDPESILHLRQSSSLWPPVGQPVTVVAYPGVSISPLAELARLVIPVSCPGCGAPDVQWCADCVAPLLRRRPMRVEGRVPRLDRLDGRTPLPVWAISEYQGPTRSLIVHWKDGGRTDLDKLFAAAAASGVEYLAEDAEPQPLRIVPAPSNPASQRARGRAHLDPLAAAIVAALRAQGWPDVALTRVLSQARTARDQVGRGARARGASTPILVRATTEHPKPLVLLVDDVVTTGATLASAELALERAGFPVLGAIVLAATAPPAARRVTVSRVATRCFAPFFGARDRVGNQRTR